MRLLQHGPDASTQPSGAPVWQWNYFERVVRNQAELVRIREYVATNPAPLGPRPGECEFPPRCFRIKGSRHTRDAGDSVSATPMHDAGTLPGRRGAWWGLRQSRRERHVWAHGRAPIPVPAAGCVTVV